jgi:hypothetical protein
VTIGLFIAFSVGSTLENFRVLYQLYDLDSFGALPMLHQLLLALNAMTAIIVFLVIVCQIVCTIIFRKQRAVAIPVVKVMAVFFMILIGLVLRWIYFEGTRAQTFTFEGYAFSLAFILGQALISAGFLIMVFGALLAHKRRLSASASATTTSYSSSLLDDDSNELDQQMRSIPSRYEV